MRNWHAIAYTKFLARLRNFMKFNIYLWIGGGITLDIVHGSLVIFPSVCWHGHFCFFFFQYWPSHKFCRDRNLWRNPRTKFLRVFLLAIDSHLSRFALRFYFFKLTQPFTYFFKLTQPLTYVFSSVTVHCKGERRKTDRKPYPIPYGLKNHTEASENPQHVQTPNDIVRSWI